MEYGLDTVKTSLQSLKANFFGVWGETGPPVVSQEGRPGSL